MQAHLVRALKDQRNAAMDAAAEMRAIASVVEAENVCLKTLVGELENQLKNQVSCDASKA